MSGPEERMADQAESYQRDMEDASLREQLADETEFEPSRIPVVCIVRGHDWHPLTHYCRRCGQDRNDEIRAAHEPMVYL